MMSFHYGQTIFEGMKAFKNTNGSVYISRPKDHAARFNISAERMCMPAIPEELFVDALTEFVALDQQWIPIGESSSLYIRPFMFATEEHVGVRPSKKYRFIIFASPANLYYAKPLRVKIETKYTRATPGGVGFAKTGGNYSASLLPTEEAKKEGFDQIIWTDALTHTKVEESGTMNLMFVFGGKLVTPGLKDTVLKGITRDSFLALARKRGFEVEERDIYIEEVIAVLKDGTLTEVFGTGTAVVVAPIQSITHEGVEYMVSQGAASDDSSNISASISKTIAEDLIKIRKGESPDEFGWMHKVV
jgi:branched-chain amino acid aminotransferase